MTPQDFPILKNKFVMVDLETMSTRANAVILSIGAVKFTFEHGITDEFKVNIDPKSCKKHGLHIDKTTVDWWASQSKEARLSWQKDPDPISLPDAMDKFLDWWGTNKNLWFVCNGMSFDAPILSSALIAVDKRAPWKYRNELDLRTIYNLFGVSTESLKTHDGVYHDSLFDSKFQTHNLLKLFEYEAF
jgi:exodeoxyribonuclease VIII